MLDHVQVEPHAEVPDLGKAVPTEHRNEAGKPEDQPRLKPELRVASEENRDPAIRQRGQLGKESRRGGVLTLSEGGGFRNLAAALLAKAGFPRTLGAALGAEDGEGIP